MCALYLPLFHLISVSFARADADDEEEKRRRRRRKKENTLREREIDNVYLSIIIYYLLFIHHLQSSDRIEHDIFDRKNRVHEEEKRKK